MQHALDALDDAQRILAVRTQRRYEAKHGLVPQPYASPRSKRGVHKLEHGDGTVVAQAALIRENAARAFLPRHFDAHKAAHGARLLRSARVIQAAVRVRQAAMHKSVARLQANY